MNPARHPDPLKGQTLSTTDNPALRRTRFTRAEHGPSRTADLPDLIADYLALFLSGINPGLASAAGLHFANPGSRLRPALHQA
ncbi:hypothetical protein [Streptomyces sp. NPDC048295]|uniref:hypothetical protein n=1 Tax=Streptomyces sp. NPDC048295 TaxID=3154617 RepID=UPI003449C4C8